MGEPAAVNAFVMGVLRGSLPNWYTVGQFVELTESQRAFLAIASGVPAETIVEDGKTVMRTEPCGLVWTGWRWEIRYLAKKG